MSTISSQSGMFSFSAFCCCCSWCFWNHFFRILIFYIGINDDSSVNWFIVHRFFPAIFFKFLILLLNEINCITYAHIKGKSNFSVELRVKQNRVAVRCVHFKMCLVGLLLIFFRRHIANDEWFRFGCDLHKSDGTMWKCDNISSGGSIANANSVSIEWNAAHHSGIPSLRFGIFRYSQLYGTWFIDLQTWQYGGRSMDNNTIDIRLFGDSAGRIFG